MNWKLVTVILASLILLVVCYLTLMSSPDIKKYFMIKKIQLEEPIHDLTVIRKIKKDISEEEFKNLKIPEGYIGYYFFSECPYYKEEFFLVDLTNEGLEKYYVPEKGYLIVVKKDHRWTKEPDFNYWVSE